MVVWPNVNFKVSFQPRLLIGWIKPYLDLIGLERHLASIKLKTYKDNTGHIFDKLLSPTSKSSSILNHTNACHQFVVSQNIVIKIAKLMLVALLWWWKFKYYGD